MTHLQTSYRDVILSKLNSEFVRQQNIRRFVTNYSYFADKKSTPSATTSEGDSNLSSEVSQLKKEIAELYKVKSKNDQVLIDTKQKITKLENDFAVIEKERDDLAKKKTTLFASIARVEVEISNLKQENSTIRDERLVLQMSHQSLLKQKEKLERENIQLLNKIRELDVVRVKIMNDELEAQENERQKKIEEQIADAVATTGSDARLMSQLEKNTKNLNIDLIGDILPTGVQFKLNTNHGEINDINWLEADTFATGCGDRNVHIWRIDSKMLQSKVATLIGCNAAVTRIDYCREKRSILASSNDNTIRLWNMDTKRLVLTLTGHTDKVSSARFYEDHKIISGSYDRFVRIWDAINQRCERTFSAGSTVLDVVGRCSVTGRGFISGHYDRKLRFWDDRSSHAVAVMELGSRITSLDVSQGTSHLLVSTRDDTLNLIDIRTNKVIHFYSAEQYKTSSDMSRAVLSAGGEYVAAGSSNGSVFIWNKKTTRLAKIVRSFTTNPLLSLTWHSSGKGLLSADKFSTVVHYE